jgi:hypothetical protein
MEEGGRRRPRSKIALHVYYPGRCVAKVNVCPDAKVHDLHRLVPTDEVTFICNGVVLAKGCTFGFYGLREKDIVVCLPVAADSGDVCKWISLTRDSEAFNDRVSAIINPGTSREAARLRDFQFMRMERKPRAFRKLADNIQRRAGNHTVEKRSSPTLFLSGPDFPSVDPLPVFWPGIYGQDDLIDSEAVPLVKDERQVMSLRSISSRWESVDQ